MAANEDEVRLRLTAETVGYKRAWAEVRVQTARDLAAIKTSVVTNLGQARTSAAQHLAGIQQAAATHLGQTRVAVANQLAQVRTATAQQLSNIRLNAARQLQAIRQNASQSLSSIGSQFESAGRRISAAITLPLVALAAFAIRGALQLDTFRNRLIAIEGSAQLAERRITILRKLAQESVGVTTKVALDAYSQFAAIGGITERTIERQIKAFGKLNAIFSIDDPQIFNRNLVQIFEKNFNTRDIREALGRVPIFNQLLREAFGTGNPEKLRALKAAGKLTLESFMSGLASAVETDSRLVNVRESLSVRFQKTFERIQFALAPIGETILRTVEPLIDPAVKLIERLGKAFADLPGGVRLGLVALGGLAAAVGSVVFILGSLASSIAAIATAVSAVGAPVIAAVAVVVAAVGAAVAALYLAWQTNFGGIRETTLSVLTEVSAFARSVVGQLVSWWKENLPLMRQSPETVLNGIRAFWAEHGQQITTIVKAAWENIKTVVGVVLSGLLSFIKIVLQVINNDWRGAWETYQAALATAMRAVVSILSRMPSIFWGTLRTVVGIVINAASEIKERAIEAGFQIGASLAASILRGIGSVNPQAAIAAALITAIAGASAQARGARPQSVPTGLTREQQDAVDAAQADADALLNKAFQRPRPAEDLGGNKKKGNDKAHQEAVRGLEQQEREIEEVYRRETEALNREFDLQLISSRAYTQGIVDAAQERFEKLQAVYQKEIAAAKKKSEREKFENDLKKAENERDKIKQDAQDAQNKRETDLLKQHRESLLNLQDKYDEQAISAMQARADLEASSYEDAESKAFDIQTKGFDRRLQALRDDEAAFYATQKDINDANEQLAQEYSDKIAAIVAQQEQAQREHDARVEAARQKDLERQRKYQDELFGLEQTYEANDREAKNREIEKALKSPFYRIRVQAIAARVALEIDDINRRERLAKKRLDDEEAAAKREYRQRNQDIKDTQEYYDHLLLLKDTYDALRKQNEDKANQDRKDSTDRGGADAERENPLSARNLFGDRYADISDTFGPLAAAIDGVKGLALNAFSAMAEGFGQMVENWVLTGSLGEGGIRRLIAGILAQFAKLTFVQGVMELAYAAAGLTHWGRIMYGAPGPHLKAAAFLFAASGAAAVVGRAVAGNSNQQGTASAAVGGGGGEAQPKNQQFTFGVGSTPASDDVRGHGLMGNVLAPLFNRLEAMERRDEARDQRDQMRTALIVQSHKQVAGALSTFVEASPEGIVMKGAPGARAAIAEAVIDHSGSDDGFNDKLARNLRVP